MGGHAEFRRLREVRGQIRRCTRNGRTGRVFRGSWVGKRAWRCITRISELLFIVVVVFHIIVI
jgi:hypothetical protein